MTFENTALAIDGALLGSSLVRRGEFAATSGSQGIVQKGDLEVNALPVPGIGVQIESGVGIVRNDYQDSPNETYVVSNPGVHTIPSSEMPAASGVARSFILAIVIGDPDFSQAGHPWMGADDPPDGEEQSFEYVRPTLIQVSAGVTELDVAYPALVLARIDIPASTTTILQSYIHDLRTLAQPRQEQQAFVSPSGTWTNGSPVRIPSGAAYNDWGASDYSPSITIPSWASRAIVIASVNGVRLADTSANVAGGIRAKLGTVNGPATPFDFPVGVGATRANLQTGGEFDVSSIAGTTVALKIEGFEDVPGSPSNDQRLALQGGSQQIFDVRFFEE